MDVYSFNLFFIKGRVKKKVKSYNLKQLYFVTNVLYSCSSKDYFFGPSNEHDPSEIILCSSNIYYLHND